MEITLIPFLSCYIKSYLKLCLLHINEIRIFGQLEVLLGRGCLRLHRSLIQSLRGQSSELKGDRDGALGGLPRVRGESHT